LQQTAAIETVHTATVEEDNDRTFTFTWKTARVPLFFLLCMSLFGLSVYPVIIIIIALLFYTWKNSRYDTLIMSLLLLGGFQFYGGLPFVRAAIIIFVAMAGIVLLKKTPVFRKSLLAMVFYAASLFIVAKKSMEPLGHQLPILATQLYFLFFIVVLLIFSDKEFSFNEFFRRLFPYCVIICIFYCLDFFIIGGYFLLPGVDGEPLWDPDMAPFSFRMVRQRPPGLYLLALLIYPMANGWKMPKWVWIPLLGAIAATQTFTVLTGLIFGFVVAQGSFRRYGKYILTGTLFFVALYCVDSAISGGGEKSVLRIRQQVDQIFSIQQVQDEEDMAELGTGRAAQAIPKLELLYDLDMEWFGFGYLHPEKTTNQTFFVYNPFYSDVQKANELATGVEISSVQLFLNSGYFGVAAHIVWLIWLWLIVRRRPMAKCFLTVMLIMIWFGIGGYTGMNMPQGQLIAATVFAGILLQDPDRPSNISRRHERLLREHIDKANAPEDS
jgi:hypothetical protein